MLEREEDWPIQSLKYAIQQMVLSSVRFAGAGFAYVLIMSTIKLKSNPKYRPDNTKNTVVTKKVKKAKLDVKLKVKLPKLKKNSPAVIKTKTGKRGFWLNDVFFTIMEDKYHRGRLIVIGPGKKILDRYAGQILTTDRMCVAAAKQNIMTPEGSSPYDNK
jgi:hypothetical protein